MIRLNDGTILRNLQEQVQYLTTFHNENIGIAEWGIHVLGQVETYEELLEIPTDDLKSGDTYAVGTSAPYDFYIWTPSSVAGQPDYWFPYGQISIVGPEGPKGDKGDKGDTGASTRWYANSTQIPPSYVNAHDMLLITGNNENLGNVYIATPSASGTPYWSLQGNIRGPQGIQGLTGPQGPQGEKGAKGEKGDTGAAGKFVTIAGILTAAPTTSPVLINDLSIAYLVGTTSPYDLYIQMGTTPATAQWRNVGPFNIGTVVSVGGNFVNSWDADTKVDKKTVTSEQILTIKPDGSTDTLAFSTEPVAHRIPRYNSNRQLKVNAFPDSDNDAASKIYVDTAIGAATPEGEYAVEITIDYGTGTSTTTYLKIMFQGLASNPEAYVGATNEDGDYIIIGYNLYNDAFLVMDTGTLQVYQTSTYTVDV